MKKLLYSLKKYPLAIGVIALLLGLISIQILDSSVVEGNIDEVLLRILLSIVCGAAIYSISGARTFENLDNETGYVIKRCSGFLIFSLVMSSLAFLGFILQEAELAANWPVNLLLTICMALSVGIFEEMCFRVVINDAMLYQFRNNKHIFIWIAIVSSVGFGATHVIGAEVDSGLSVLQILLKILTIGLLGFAFLILYWKTRNFWAIGLAHGLYDLFTMIPEEIFDVEKKFGNYVDNRTVEADGVTMNTGYFNIIIYVVQLVVFICILISFIKMLKNMDFEKMREEW